MGEEPENEKSQSSESHHRKQQSSLFHQVPMVYNSSQHDISGKENVINFVLNYDKVPFF